MKTIYLSLGSNITPKQHLKRCLVILEERYGRIRCSPIYKSAAYGFDGDDFLNQVVSIDTQDTLEQVRYQCMAIEEDMGRVYSRKMQSRQIDIDMILCEPATQMSTQMRLPREDIWLYSFVARPLLDIYPTYVLPSGKSLESMTEELEKDIKLCLIPPLDA